MVFVGGALVGLVIGAAATLLVVRRSGRANLLEGRGLAVSIAAVALVVAAIALANTHHAGGNSAAAPPATSPPTAAPSAAPTTTTAGTSPATSSTTTASTPTGEVPTGEVTVPKVEALTRAEAVPILEHAGLKVSIETLSLSNVPPGFVISQSPLPGATTAAGTVVALVVSAAA